MPLPDSLRRVLSQQTNKEQSVGYVHFTMRDGTSVREYDNGRVVTWPSVPAIEQPPYEPDPGYDPFPS